MALHTALKFKTSKPISEIEAWLEKHCQGEWDVDIEAIATGLGKKSVAVYFETDTDKNAFKAASKTFI